MNEIFTLNGFLRKINQLYPATFKNDEVIDTWNDACIKILDKFNIDYNKLYDIVINENPQGNFAPNLTWVKEQALKCKIRSNKPQEKWLHPKIYNPIYKTVIKKDCFPVGTTEEQIIRTYEKMFPNTTGWRVVYE